MSKYDNFNSMLPLNNSFMLSVYIGEEQTRVNFKESKIGFKYKDKWVINPFRTPEGEDLSYSEMIDLYGYDRVNLYILNVWRMLTKLKLMGSILDTSENVVRAIRTLREIELAKEEGRKPNFDNIRKDYPDIFQKKKQYA